MWNNYARVYLIRQTVMSSAILRSICKCHVSGRRKIDAVIPGKAGCIFSWGGRRINEWWALLMYRISVDESWRSLCLCDTRNAANCLYAIRERRKTSLHIPHNADFRRQCIILGSAIFWMNAGTVGYKNIVTSRRDDNVAVMLQAWLLEKNERRS